MCEPSGDWDRLERAGQLGEWRWRYPLRCAMPRSRPAASDTSALSRMLIAAVHAWSSSSPVIVVATTNPTSTAAPPARNFHQCAVAVRSLRR